MQPSTRQSSGIADEGAVEAVWGLGGLDASPFLVQGAKGKKRNFHGTIFSQMKKETFG